MPPTFPRLCKSCCNCPSSPRTKEHQMKRPILISMITISLAGLGANPMANAAPQGSAFSFQGQLKQAGAAVSGSVDMAFSLWDAAGSGSPPTGGTQIAVTVTFDGQSGRPQPVSVS